MDAAVRAEGGMRRSGTAAALAMCMLIRKDVLDRRRRIWWREDGVTPGAEGRSSGGQDMVEGRGLGVEGGASDARVEFDAGRGSSSTPAEGRAETWDWQTEQALPRVRIGDSAQRCAYGCRPDHGERLTRAHLTGPLGSFAVCFWRAGRGRVVLVQKGLASLEFGARETPDPGGRSRRMERRARHG
ncbi:hypothetical protein MAPG_07188 [Magnaporthiopsis poae ATCC 64411]|uniref:Uncharacterized protein n=1 Tax=Magnaporthiopsis poae (strain ATCC 64411 / 73-15) TaxID=644358 RepID=A0A0C4E402_MAGP6|nr:hypothetical protein MAPG_07188 [Magnaporthiopsis poae ATCC 64411]